MKRDTGGERGLRAVRTRDAIIYIQITHSSLRLARVCCLLRYVIVSHARDTRHLPS